jgi:hypothetical protein
MLTKLERFVSKNIPETALTAVGTKMTTIPHDYQHNPLTQHTIYKWHGYIQRKNIEPKGLLPSENTNRIGYHQRHQMGPNLSCDAQASFAEHNFNKRMRITFGETNHMQSTPFYKKGKWLMTAESSSLARSHSMLWFRCGDDSFRNWGEKEEMRFQNVEDAVATASANGWEYEVVYPHERYHQTKAYADNFSFLKEEISDIEDEEAAAFEIMQKLV